MQFLKTQSTFSSAQRKTSVTSLIVNFIIVFLSAKRRRRIIIMKMQRRVISYPCTALLQNFQHLMKTMSISSFSTIGKNTSSKKCRGSTFYSFKGTLIPQSNRPLYSNIPWLVHWLLMGGLLQLVHRGGAWAGCGPAQSPSITAHP